MLFRSGLADPHTQYQLESALPEDVQDIVGAMASAGPTGLLSVSYSDPAGTLVIDAVTSTLDERTQDQIGAHVKGSGLVLASYDDAGTGDTTLSLDTATLDERIMDVIATMLQAGTNVTLTYNDAGNQLTVAASGGGGGITDATAIAYAIGLG